MGVGEMGCNVPSEVVDFDDGFQPEAIVWANPTRLDRAQNPPSTDTSVYKTFVKSPRRLLVFIAIHSFSLTYSTTRETHLRSSSKGMVGSRGEWRATAPFGVVNHDDGFWTRTV